MTFYPTFTRLVPCGLLAGLALALAIPAHAQQTNDPLVGQQQYLFDVHKVDEAWAVTTGSSNTLIAVHSVLGFRGTHNDLSGRTLSPRGATVRPEFGFATAMVGAAAANTDNGIGIAGIDRQAMLRSYSVLRNSQSGDNPNNIIEFTNDDGGTERFYLDLDTFSQRVNEARSDGADVHLFEYGLPTGAANGRLSLRSIPIRSLSPTRTFLHYHRGSRQFSLESCGRPARIFSLRFAGAAGVPVRRTRSASSVMQSSTLSSRTMPSS